MSYIRKLINGSEKILVISRPHWIYLLEGVVWFGGLALTGFAIDYFLYVHWGLIDIGFYSDIPFLHPHIFVPTIPLIFSLIGFAIFWTLFLFYCFVEVVLTDERIIYKKGLFFVEVDQVDLDDISAEHILHGLLGWLLGYGKIHMDCRFIGDVWLPAIYKPYKLIKAMHIARAKNPNIEYAKDEFIRNLDHLNKRERQHAHPLKHIKTIFSNASLPGLLPWRAAS